MIYLRTGETFAFFLVLKLYNNILNYRDLSLKSYIKFKIKVFQSISDRVFKNSQTIKFEKYFCSNIQL